jgi:hypothetical protein
LRGKIALQRKTKRKFLKFIGLIGVISIISGGTVGYFFQWRMKHVLQRYAFMIKSQGLMLKERGAQLKELGAAISSYDETKSDPSASSQRQTLQKYAHEVQKQGEELEQYGGQLISAIQAEEPEDAPATIADVQLFVPENLDTIKKQQQKIEELEVSALKLKGRIQDLELQLYDCMAEPRGPMLYPPERYYKNHPRYIGPNGQNHREDAE